MKTGMIIRINGTADIAKVTCINENWISYESTRNNNSFMGRPSEKHVDFAGGCDRKAAIPMHCAQCKLRMSCRKGILSFLGGENDACDEFTWNNK